MSYQDPEPVDPYASPEAKDPASWPPPISPDERTWGMLCHLTALAGFIGIPFGNIIGPLVVWLIKKDEMPFVDDQGKEALNFQISLIIYLLVGAAISGILVIVVIGIVLLFVVLLGVPIFGLVMTIIAALRANQGEAYRYPMCIRFLN
ncbi:MAG: DUF4870 domain-containing protein [Planctomycetota bacterium]|jgi:uncharacterized Tic20 family protein